MQVERSLRAALVGCLLFAESATVWAGPGSGEENGPEPTGPVSSVGFQATAVAQAKPSFNALYSGPHSLSREQEQSHSGTATGYVGLQPWSGGELWFDPEVALGHPFSGLTGLGGFTNGEIAKSVGESPSFYTARLFLRQTWNLGGDEATVASGQNQFSGTVTARRLALTVGRIAVNDIFDVNGYAHDPRTQFLNWVLIADGAYDFPGDTRGYTSGIAAEYDSGAWSLRLGRFAVPETPNGAALDGRLLSRFGDQMELEHDHSLSGRQGKLRLLGWHTRALLARYDDALRQAAGSGGAPDLNAVRGGLHDKYGAGINLEQAVTEDAGVFARIMWADGRTETDAFTDVDRSTALGISLDGAAWGRSGDTIGIALAENAISRHQQRYLAAGGLTYFIGDGGLRYGQEEILETYYSRKLANSVWLSADLQEIANPAYNRARGRVTTASLRLHSEL